MRFSKTLILKLGIICFLLCTVWYVLTHPTSLCYPGNLYCARSPIPSSSSNQSVITNETLGFEKVFAIGLPERTDKRDALALTSSLTGFKLDWIDGVRGEIIPDKAVPYGVYREALFENNLGSWRGHMNAIRTIVEKGYSTTLIMEDDMDWDVRLKSQLVQIANGTRYLQSSQSSHNHSSPYGNDWDLLWLGHCGEKFPETLEEIVSSSPSELRSISRKYTISSDPTVPPPEFTTGHQNFKASPYTRWVHISGNPVCSFAYALSLEGARKALYDLSVDHLTGPFDIALQDLCRKGRHNLGMRCISVTPPLFFHHKAKGWISGDSDIQKVGQAQDDNVVREKGTTENIVWSARNNIRNMIMKTKMESQFPQTGNME